jgi:hypothetical protein
MTVIQLDMYEVQLGAAVLLQFNNHGDPVRILADAGIHAGGYKRNHVHQKLKGSFQGFNGNAPDRIDLLLGSHYDKDHLDGLIDVASDTSIAITEAWLPPVEDDSDSTELGDAEFATQSDLPLGVKFAGKAGDAEFDRYIQSQRERCKEALKVRMLVLGAVADATENTNSDDLDFSQKQAASVEPTSRELMDSCFEIHILGAEQDLQLIDKRHDAVRQADEEVDNDQISQIEEYVDEFHRVKSLVPGAFDALLIDDVLPKDFQQDPVLGSNLFARAAMVRKSAARNAINASSLKKLVDELHKRNIPIRFERISQGNPEFFLLNPSGKFRSVSKPVYTTSNEPKLTLLGPSDVLIKKHKNLLPSYQTTLMLAELIPIKSITPSNQLSYVAKFEFQGQSVLVSGDTGFVDFKPSRAKPYFQALLDELDNLEIVQIAHHGGNNAHFYRVLLKAPFGSMPGTAPFLLLSHRKHDRHRPSSAFDQFVTQLNSAGSVPQILFTSEPTLAKVQAFKQLVAPVVGLQGSTGDVRLEFDGQSWSVEAHAVKV